MKIQLALMPCLTLASALLLGCDAGNDDADAPLDSQGTTPVQRDAADPVTPEAPEDRATTSGPVSDLIGGAQDRATETGDQIREMGEQGRQSVAEAAEGLKQDLPEAPADIDVNSIDMSEGAELTEPQATAVFDKVRNLISTNSLDQAEQWINKLDGVTLPTGFDRYLVDAKKLLASAKKGVGSVEGMLNK